MKIEISQSLKDLNKIFLQNGSPLYIVGGYIRNACLGFCETDIDVCSSLKAEQILEMLKNTPYKAKIVNSNLGTVLIESSISDEQYEHTTWRFESYGVGGNHSPEKVEFVSDIKLDASRRDFTCNAIYYNLETEQVVDFYNGIEDVYAHILRTVETPEYVFSRDGLRILRLVRMACELDFEIDENCFSVAKLMVNKLDDISQERFNKEIISILFSDYKYDSIKNPHSPIRGLKLLSQLKAWGYVLPALSSEVGIEKINNLLEGDWCRMIAKMPPIHRVTAFVYDILFALNLPFTFKNVNLVLGQGGVMLSKNEVLIQSEIIEAYTKALAGFKTEDELRLFIQQNNKIILRLIDLGKNLNQFDNILLEYNHMKIDKVPLSLKDLDINGNDIAKFFPNVKKQQYGKILDNLLKKCCLIPELNQKKKLIEFLKKDLMK